MTAVQETPASPATSFAARPVADPPDGSVSAPPALEKLGKYVIEAKFDADSCGSDSDNRESFRVTRPD